MGRRYLIFLDDLHDRRRKLWGFLAAAALVVEHFRLLPLVVIAIFGGRMSASVEFEHYTGCCHVTGIQRCRLKQSPPIRKHESAHA
jgi:hypothetical protein